MSKLKLEVNPKYQESETVKQFANEGIMITPPLGGDADFMFRVKLSKKQSLVAFPKFSVCIGIGFQHEKDWNTNLPYECDTEEIYNHIKHNKGDKTITKKQCLEGIAMLPKAAKSFTERQKNTN